MTAEGLAEFIALVFCMTIIGWWIAIAIPTGRNETVDPHQGHDISIEQVYENGRCIASVVKCDTCNVEISRS